MNIACFGNPHINTDRHRAVNQCSSRRRHAPSFPIIRIDVRDGSSLPNLDLLLLKIVCPSSLRVQWWHYYRLSGISCSEAGAITTKVSTCRTMSTAIVIRVVSRLTSKSRSQAPGLLVSRMLPFHKGVKLLLGAV
jgi:hypothetical protein